MTIDSIATAGTNRSLERPLAAAESAVLQGTGRAPATATETAAAVTASAPAPTLEQVSQAVSKLNKAAQEKAQGVEFSIDGDTKLTVIKVVDQSTKEVLRQMPTPEALEIAKSIDSARSLILKETA
ncbi:flagellar protein FlaG [Pseudoduganella sp. RAF53_2]|jgi:flagellar protein FlaG|uniref:flagellar protein FlaG n=1 Tax=unclassified Pseudoduganella TaxID=2637179 RepID=UPI003F9862B9